MYATRNQRRQSRNAMHSLDSRDNQLFCIMRKSSTGCSLEARITRQNLSYSGHIDEGINGKDDDGGQDGWKEKNRKTANIYNNVTFSQREPLNVQQYRKCQGIRKVNFSKEKPLTVKLVKVPEIDTQFNNIAEIFNKQQDDCLALREAIQNLKSSYDCSPASSLSSCIKKIQQEHSACNVQVCMEGYRFWLDVGLEEVPEKLKQAQEQVGELNRAAKGIASTTIQEMINSVHQCQDNLLEKVKGSTSEYLDQIRLERNLQENIEKINQAQQFSEQYKEEVSCVLMDMAKLANVTL